MRKAVLLLAGIIALTAADPHVGASATVRSAHHAYQAGDLAKAAALYERALEESSDPRQLAFDLASIKYRLALQTGNLELILEAEQYYRCYLGSDDPRRAAACYGIGNCLLARAAGKDLEALRHAVAAYNLCLAETAVSAALAEDARHNRERAKLLLLQAQALAAADQQSDQQPSNDTKPRPPEPNNSSKQVDTNPQENPLTRPRSVGEAETAKGESAKDAAKTDEFAPGKGALPPLPDESEPTPLSARSASAYLDQAAARIKAERARALRSRAARPPAAGVRDW